jgi:hypothetical protein
LEAQQPSRTGRARVGRASTNVLRANAHGVNRRDHRASPKAALKALKAQKAAESTNYERNKKEQQQLVLSAAVCGFQRIQRLPLIAAKSPAALGTRRRRSRNP